MASRLHPLKRYRLRSGLTLDALAQRAGTTKSWLSRIESGADIPSASLIRRLIDSSGGALCANHFFAPSEKNASSST